MGRWAMQRPDSLSQFIHGLLCDIDGVLSIDGKMIPGALEFYHWTRELQLPLVLVTNSTTLDRDAIAARLKDQGMPIESSQVLSTPAVVAAYMRSHGHRTARLIINDSIKPEFDFLKESDTRPDALVIGDYGNRWSFELMNELFGHLMEGSELLALHKGKFFQVAEGLQLDVGAFIQGLEYSSGVHARSFGKPEVSFYQQALDMLNHPADQVVMIGDDIMADIDGAQQIGIRGILVKTGKYRESHVHDSGVMPFKTIESIADAAEVLSLMVRPST